VVTGFDWVSHLQVDDTIDLNEHIVSSDTGLGWNLDDLLSQVVHIGHLVNKRNLPVEAGLHLLVELFETMQHHRILLTNYNSDA